MPAWFGQLSAFAIFLAIAAVGFLFLLVSLIFGEIFGHFGDGDFGHDLDHGGPSLLSPRVISVFVTAFGGVGAVATQYGLSPIPASGLGVAGGVVFASIIYAFGHFLYSQQSATEVHTAELVGQRGRVIVAIPAGGVGQVRCQLGEHLIDKIARSHDGTAIAENAVVRVEEVLGETVVVRRE
jgi:membrane protein implicated in regulation of membrane protease activity